MPDINAKAFGKLIKEDTELKDTVLVLCTPQNATKNICQFKKIGFTGFLTKPIKRDQLYDCLTPLLEETSTTSESASTLKENVTTTAIVKNNNQRILLVEDNLVNQKIALKIIERKGYHVTAVNNGIQAINALKKEAFNLVFMDVQMPEMDGLEATSTIRDHQSDVLNPDIPIVAMTAHAMKGDREKCIEAGMDDYLSKPIRPDLIYETINRYLSQ